MGQVKSRRKKLKEQESNTEENCAANILTDDALLTIFSFLVSLSDKGCVARLVLYE